MNLECWGEIELLFDSYDEMSKRLGFLRELVSQTNICTSTECKIFPALNQFKDHVKILTLFGCETPKQAKTKIKDVLVLKKFETTYSILEKESQTIFSKIFAMFVTMKTKEKRLETWHERQIEIMKVQNQSKFPISQEFTDGGQNYIDKVEENIEDLEDFKKAKSKMKKQAK